MPPLFRKHLGLPGLLSTIRGVFSKIDDSRKFSRNISMTLTDILMSGFAVFHLKCCSLLEFDKKRREEPTRENLRSLYHVENPPSDTYMRERLDEVDPKDVRPIFKKIFSRFQRAKGLEEYAYLQEHVLISIDGTGHFSSGNVSCPHCCQKRHSDGSKTYYHQMLGACLVHPDKKNVIPLCPEVILNQDGSTKNDCERNACKRFLENLHKEHPSLKAIIIQDGLSSNAPNIQMIQKYNLKYILIAKPGDHRSLFQIVEEDNATKYEELKDENGYFHQFRFLNKVPINNSNKNVKVNFLEYRVTDPKGKEKTFSWVTNIHLTKNNLTLVARAGRARWKIENETFNTLKNLGYNLEHNYGHGKKHLSTIFCMLMIAAFLIDQIQDLTSDLFKRCKEIAGTYRCLWETMRSFFRYFCFPSWEDFFLIIARQKPPDGSKI